MPVTITPSGTRGVSMPMPPKALRKPLFSIGAFFMRLRGAHILELVTTGAKTGQEHSVPLGYFEDGPNAWLIVASFAGSARHPAWYFNMARNPDKIWIRLNGRRIKVQADTLSGEARTTAWQHVTREAPGYASYETKTDREIPVVRLSAV